LKPQRRNCDLPIKGINAGKKKYLVLKGILKIIAYSFLGLISRAEEMKFCTAGKRFISCPPGQPDMDFTDQEQSQDFSILIHNTDIYIFNV
jgi:hypothetical protein